MDLVLGVLLVHLVPVLGSPDPTAPATIALLLGLVALISLTPGTPMRSAFVGSAPATVGAVPPFVLPSRVTDPVHHPRRPRAPGPA